MPEGSAVLPPETWPVDSKHNGFGRSRRSVVTKIGGSLGRRRDATPSNRSAEASRAPRGYVCDDPLASCRDRVGQSQPGPGSATPGKSPFHTTDHHRSDTSPRSDREPLAGLKADPRSGLAAFSRPPSVPPCGFPSGFPHSHLAAVAWGSAGFRLRTDDRLRHTSHKVNGYSRNPDVLPTFSSVIPNGGRKNPQLLHMLSRKMHHLGRSPHPRPTAASRRHRRSRRRPGTSTQ